MDFLDFYHVNDRRTHRRFAVAMSARLYHANGRFSLCSTADLSLAGAAVHLVGCTPQPVIAFGSDETGKVAVTGFDVCDPFVRLVFEASSESRAVIKRALRALGDRHMIQPLPTRRGERLSTRNVMLTRSDGSHMMCDILDMAANGMLLAGSIRPPLGERVRLGKTTGIVVRHDNHGFAIRTLDRAAMAGKVVRFPGMYRQPTPPPSPSFDGIA
ncbi:MAG TPA: PilZ domain-containing protein [Rhizomicrobium sp.]|jgi:hypothetical protein